MKFKFKQSNFSDKANFDIVGKCFKFKSHCHQLLCEICEYCMHFDGEKMDMGCMWMARYEY